MTQRKEVRSVTRNGRTHQQRYTVGSAANPRPEQVPANVEATGGQPVADRLTRAQQVMSDESQPASDQTATGIPTAIPTRPSWAETTRANEARIAALTAEMQTANSLRDLLAALRAKRATVTAEIDKYTYNYYGAIEPGSVDPDLAAAQEFLHAVINRVETRLREVTGDE